MFTCRRLSVFACLLAGLLVAVTSPACAEANRSSSSGSFSSVITPLPTQPDKVTTTPTTTGIVVSGDLTSLSADQLAQKLAGEGVVISNATTKCAPVAAGAYSGGGATLGIESGIIISSGDVKNVKGPNSSGGITGSNGFSGDADLDLLIPGYKTHDACILEFDFVPDTDVASFRYVFGSDEYNEYVNTSFNDVFGFFVNGENCAVVNGDPISINNINNGKPYGSGGPNSDLYVNNETKALNTEMDGLTKVLYCAAKVSKGEINHVKLSVADAGDSILDSNVFVEAGSMKSVDFLVYSYLADSTKSGDSGTGVTYTFVVTNIGGQSDTFDGTIGANNRWTTKFALTGGKTITIGPLAPLERAYVDIIVKVPPAAVRNAQDVSLVTFSSKGKPGLITSQSMITRSTGINCIFSREVPPSYLSGIPVTVGIDVFPTCVGNGTYDLVETLPTGWVPTDISGNGTFDAATGVITWTKLPGRQQRLSYTATPQGAADAAFTEKSKAVMGTKTYPIGGDKVVKVNTGNLPADTDTSSTVILAENVGYSAAWKNGKNWSGWNPISTTYATKSAELWKKNSKYSYTPSVGSAPECWQATTPAGSGSVDRSVDSSFEPGKPVTVTISVAPDAGTTAFAIEDAPPAGWGVSSITGDKGTFDINTRKVKWGVFTDTTPRVFTYTATPPAIGTHPVAFSGAASFDGGTVKLNSPVLTTSVVQNSLSVAVIGSGTVTSSPEGIICGVDCTSAFNPEAVVTLVPSPARGYTFVVWEGACSGTGVCQLPMSSSQAATARFAAFAVDKVTSSRKKAYAASGGKGSLSFTAVGKAIPTDWSGFVRSNDPWIGNVSASMKNGKGTVTFVLEPNPGSIGRMGTVSVGSMTVAISQNGVPCRVASITGDTTIAGTGGTGSISLVAPQGCSWTAIPLSNPAWLTIDDYSGSGPATLTFTAEAAAGASRSAAIKFVSSTGQSKTVTIRQSP